MQRNHWLAWSGFYSLKGLWDKFRKLGCHIIPMHSKSEIIQPLAIANCLNIPSYVVFDSDNDKPDKSGSREKHKKDNTVILKLAGIANPEPFPTSHLIGERVTLWAKDITKTVEEEIGGKEWAEFQVNSYNKYGDPGGLKKNPLVIANSLIQAWGQGKKSNSLEKLCEEIIKFAEVVI